MPIDNHVADIPLWIRDYPGGEAIYRAGLAAGIERAAQKCDEYDVPQRTYASENTDHYRGFRAGAVRCATEIRGLLK